MTSQEVSDKSCVWSRFGAPKPASVLKGAAVDIDTVIKLRTNGLLLDGILVRFCFGTRGRTIASGPPQVHLLRYCGCTGLHPSDEARGHVCAMLLEGGDDHFLKSLSFILCSWNASQLARVGVMAQSQPLAFSFSSLLGVNALRTVEAEVGEASWLLSASRVELCMGTDAAVAKFDVSLVCISFSRNFIQIQLGNSGSPSGGPQPTGRRGLLIQVLNPSPTKCLQVRIADCDGQSSKRWYCTQYSGGDELALGALRPEAESLARPEGQMRGCSTSGLPVFGCSFASQRQ